VAKPQHEWRARVALALAEALEAKAVEWPRATRAEGSVRNRRSDEGTRSDYGVRAQRALAGAVTALHIWAAARNRQIARDGGACARWLRRSARSGRHHATHIEKESLPMKVNKNLGMLLLGIYLIIYGLVNLFKITFTGLFTVVAIYVLITGLVILLFDKAST
jgi:hypothetical protein